LPMLGRSHVTLHQATTMSTSPVPPQQYIVADDDDVNDEDIPGFTQPTVHGGQAPPNPGAKAPLEPVVLTPNPALSGNIGSSSGTSAPGHSNSTRQQYGGVRLETRYSTSPHQLYHKCDLLFQ
jgi:hypothetical protein